MDSDKEVWAEIWEVFQDSPGAPWRDVEVLPDDRLPAIEGAELERCARFYCETTGRGCEAAHHRWFGCLSRPLLNLFASLMMALEALGLWPEQIQMTLIALIPKQDGGRRPIGLLPGFVRVCMGSSSQPIRR